jgi:chemotaxis protein MotB
MARKKYQEEHENHERWLVSYADFMTLLFAFFVVMYAISSVNDGKYRVLSESLTGAFRQNQVAGGKIPDVAQVVPQAVMPFPILKSKNAEALKKERDKMTSVAKDVMAVLEPLVREGKVRVTQTSRGVSIEINASVLFAPGEAKLSQDSNEALRVIANVLKNDDHAIQVEGFTDNLPIKNSVFPSNWELSAVRASSVARLFMEQGVDENRLVAVGQGPKNPVGSNDTVEGRSRNRRVTVTILSMLPDPAVEVPVAASSKK